VGKKAACVARPQKVQQEKKLAYPIKEEAQEEERKKSRVEEEKAQLLELGWCTKEVVVLYLTCERCKSQGCHVEDNRGQGVIFRRKLKEMK